MLLAEGAGVPPENPTMTDYESQQAKTEEQLAREYLTGAPDPNSRRWWINHWQWEYSPYWDKLARAHEAICLLAWEENPPVLDQWHDESFEALAALNAHARGYRTTLQKQCYWYKNRAIREAMDRGLVLLRMVRSVQPCRTCNGTGKWTDWNSMFWREPDEEPYREKCRRCVGRGTVNLDFHECNVANRYTFHQPHDHTSPFAHHEIQHLRPWPTDWQTNRPAVKLPREQVADLLAMLKRRYWEPSPGYVHEIYGSYMDVPCDVAASGLR